MKYAIVQNQRQEAQPRLRGECPVCRATVITKCGEIRVWHWSHYRKPDCDPWWENETPWHRAWKDLFPTEWQEVVAFAESGEKHVADVKTEHGQVIEFQHSYLSSEERRGREAFHGPMVWVVDGLRRKRDFPQFLEILKRGHLIPAKYLIVAAPEDAGSLLRNWSSSQAPVFFDFGNSILWRLDPKRANGLVYLSPVRKANFVDSFKNGVQCGTLPLSKLIGAFPPQVRPLSGFERYIARKQAARLHIRL